MSGPGIERFLAGTAEGAGAGRSFEWLTSAAPYLWEGAQVTLQLTAVSALLGMVLGTVLACARLYGPAWVARAAAGYVNVMRAVPMILLLFWAYFVLPPFAGALLGDHEVFIGPLQAALIAFVLAEAAYYGEIVRGGLVGVGQGQMHAALALGLNKVDALLAVVVPQALRHMAPALVTQTVALLMDTSLVYVVSVNDFLGAAGRIGQRDGTLVEMYLLVAVCFWAVCNAGAWLARRLARSRAAGFS